MSDDNLEAPIKADELRALLQIRIKRVKRIKDELVRENCLLAIIYGRTFLLWVSIMLIPVSGI